jgi:hypothetical protein
MWPWNFPAWLFRLTQKAGATPSPRIAALQAAMLTGAFAMGAVTMDALRQSTPDAQAALDRTSGEAGAIDAIRTIGMANMEARATLRSPSHPEQPIEHRATYAILEYTKHEDAPEEVRAHYEAQRREVLRALYRTYHHERLQLESLVPRDEAQRLLIEQRLSELPDAEASLAEMIGDDTPLDVPDAEPDPARGMSQVLGNAQTPAPSETDTAAPSQVDPSGSATTASAATEESQSFDRALGED